MRPLHSLYKALLELFLLPPLHACRAKLVDLDLGCCVPIITGFKAASCPGTGAAAAPMVQTDIAYEVGDLSLLVYRLTC